MTKQGRSGQECVIDRPSPETCMRKKEGLPWEPFCPKFFPLKKNAVDKTEDSPVCVCGSCNLLCFSIINHFFNTPRAPFAANGTNAILNYLLLDSGF